MGLASWAKQPLSTRFLQLEIKKIRKILSLANRRLILISEVAIFRRNWPIRMGTPISWKHQPRVLDVCLACKSLLKSVGRCQSLRYCRKCMAAYNHSNISVNWFQSASNLRRLLNTNFRWEAWHYQRRIIHFNRNWSKCEIKVGFQKAFLSVCWDKVCYWCTANLNRN